MSETSQQGTVAYDIVDNVAWVRFNRPDKRNCMSPTLNREMMEVLDTLEYRDDVGVLVLSGEGTSWSAGMDLKEYFRESATKGLEGTRRAQREFWSTRTSPAANTTIPPGPGIGPTTGVSASSTNPVIISATRTIGWRLRSVTPRMWAACMTRATRSGARLPRVDASAGR